MTWITLANVVARERWERRLTTMFIHVNDAVNQANHDVVIHVNDVANHVNDVVNHVQRCG